MKAMVLRTCPEAVLIDVSHSVPPFEIGAGAFVLWAGTRHFGAGAVHLAVVDPGVGGARRALSVEVGGSWFVAPDNGLLETVLEEGSGVAAAYELARAPDAAPTFEGRDVFAPAAGALASGAAPSSLGTPIDPAGLVRLPGGGPRVIWIDHFGNLVLNLRPPARSLRVGTVDVTALARTFAAAPADVPFCYEGSMGRLEIGFAKGRAADLVRAAIGTPVTELPLTT